MASLGNVINRDDLPKADNFDPIPDGWYTATVNSAELKDTKDKTGKYIAVGYGITGPAHSGRVVFGNLNIKNRNAEAERIGMQQLGQVMGAIGLVKVQDTDQFIGGSLSIKVAYKAPVMEDGHEKYAASNEIKGYKPIEGAAAIPFPVPGTTASTPASTPPWGAH